MFQESWNHKCLTSEFTVAPSDPVWFALCTILSWIGLTSSEDERIWFSWCQWSSDGLIPCPTAQSFLISNKPNGVSEIWRSEKRCHFYCRDKTVDSWNCWNKWYEACGANSCRPLQGHDSGSADPSHDPLLCSGRTPFPPIHTHIFFFFWWLLVAPCCSATLLLCCSAGALWSSIPPASPHPGGGPSHSGSDVLQTDQWS